MINNNLLAVNYLLCSTGGHKDHDDDDESTYIDSFLENMNVSYFITYCYKQ